MSHRSAFDSQGCWDRNEADADDDRPSLADVVEGTDWTPRPAAAPVEGRGIKCGSCKGRHTTPAEVRDCYAEREQERAEAEAEARWEAEADVAFARDREAMAERGTWFGPQTEADSWGEF